MTKELEYDAVIKNARCGIWFGKNVIFGNIHGDKKGRFPDGHGIHTSSIMSVDENTNIVKTVNTVYLVEWSEHEQEKR